MIFFHWLEVLILCLVIAVWRTGAVSHPTSEGTASYFPFLHQTQCSIVKIVGIQSEAYETSSCWKRLESVPVYICLSVVQ